MGKVRLFTAVRRFLQWADVNLQPGTVAGYRHYLERFQRKVKNVLLTSLTRAKVTGWSKRWHALQAVMRLVSWCVNEAKLIKSNPLAGLKLPTPGKRHRIMDRGETLRLMRASNRHFRLFLLFIRETMARPQEVRVLSLADVVRTRSVTSPPSHFELGDAKGFDRRTDDDGVRVIAISPRLARSIKRLQPGVADASTPLLRDVTGRPWTGQAIVREMRKLRRRLGIVADRRGEQIVAYTFRHTGATNAVAAGVRDFMLAKALGHGGTRTTARYVHPRCVDVVDAMKRVWEAKTPRTPKKDRTGLRRKRPDDRR